MKWTLLAWSLLGLLSVSGCGGDDEGSATADPVTACKNATAAFCAKAFGCFTDAELQLFSSVVGNNEADCRTKLAGDRCSEEMTKCDSGETYDSAKASECLSQYEDMSCNEIKDPLTQTPAACNQTCK